MDANVTEPDGPQVLPYQPAVEQALTADAAAGVVQPRFRYPIAPKAHGAWLGAASGNAVAAAAVAIIQTEWLHHPMPQGVTDLIYLIASAVTALVGAYLMPHQLRAADPPLPPLPAYQPRHNSGT